MATDTSLSPPPTASLLELLEPIIKRVAGLDVGAAQAEDQEKIHAALNAAFPIEGEHVVAIGKEIARGVREGWLCNRGEANARFCRVAKPSPATMDQSIDIVDLEGEALRHTHPKGEITLGFRAPTCDDDAVRFDGHPPGWVVMLPGSTHTPQVTKGRMHLLYFLPGGSVRWET